MLSSLKGGMLAAVNGVRSEVEQVGKLTGSQSAGVVASGKATNGAGSKYRAELLEVESVRRECQERVKAAERDARLRLEAMELQVSQLRSENARLRWEPRKARDGLVLLCVSLSIAFTLVSFAIFAMAERQLARRSWEDVITGQVLLVLGSVLLVGAVPLTHLSGEYLYGDVGFRFYQPWAGGSLYISLQFFGWSCYALFLACALFVAFNREHVAGVVTAAGAFGAVAQVVMVSSLLSFRPEQAELESVLEKRSGYSSEGSASIGSEPEMNGVGSLVRRTSRSKSRSTEAEEGMEFDLWLDADFEWNSSYSAFRMDTDTALFAAFMGLQSTLVIISLGLGFIAERASSNQGHRAIAGTLSLALLVTSALLTHWLGGTLSHRVSWKAFQPFAGGGRFLLLQGIVWGVFALCVASQASFLGLPVYITSRLAIGSGLGVSMTKAGMLAIAGHLLLIYSISNYRDSRRRARVEKQVAENSPLRAVNRFEKAAADFRYEQISDPELLEEMYQRMHRYQGLRSILGTASVTVLCNTHWCIFIVLATAFYMPYPLLCAVGPAAACMPTPTDVFTAFEMFSVCICSFTVGYSILKTFNIRGAIRIVSLIFLTLVPIYLTLYMHQGSDVTPLLRLFCILFAVYNYRTYSGMPEVTGCREWKWFRESRWLWNVFEDYQGARLVTDVKLDEFEQADGGHALGSAQSSVRQAITCFAPHGIFPTTVIWLPNSSMFRDRFPGWILTSMTASIIHLTPFMRDVAQWAGVRDVGRESVERALRKGESPMLVVGGQSEMFLSKSWTNDIAVHRSHKGFVRMAIMYGVPLVPVFSFGEHKCMDNVYMPKMQNWFKARFGFPVPYLPYGRWFLPLNRRTPITLCVGAPVFPKGPPNPKPTNKEIDELHERYYNAVLDLFERNKARCGFPDAAISWAGKDMDKVK